MTILCVRGDIEISRGPAGGSIGKLVCSNAKVFYDIDANATLAVQFGGRISVNQSSLLLYYAVGGECKVLQNGDMGAAHLNGGSISWESGNNPPRFWNYRGNFVVDSNANYRGAGFDLVSTTFRRAALDLLNAPNMTLTQTPVIFGGTAKQAGTSYALEYQ
jgi:hypothetical protein